MGLGAFARGVGGPPERGLKRLRWALVPLRAGFGVPKRHLEGLEGLPAVVPGAAPALAKARVGGFSLLHWGSIRCRSGMLVTRPACTVLF